MPLTPAWALLQKEMFIGELLLYWLDTFGVPICTVDWTKKTAFKTFRRGDTDFLTLWLEKLLVKVYHHHQQVDQ